MDRNVEAHQGYHLANLSLQPYPHEAVVELAKRAKELGIQFKINGIPFGADYDRAAWNAFEAEFNRFRSGHIHQGSTSNPAPQTT